MSEQSSSETKKDDQSEKEKSSKINKIESLKDPGLSKDQLMPGEKDELEKVQITKSKIENSSNESPNKSKIEEKMKSKVESNTKSKVEDDTKSKNEDSSMKPKISTAVKSKIESKITSKIEQSISPGKMDYQILPPEDPWPDKIPPPRKIGDEVNLERIGFCFSRQAIATTKQNFVYKASGLTSVPVVCKVTVLDYCSPRMKENFLKDSLRIIRYVGGNGKDEPLHPLFIKIYEIFKIDTKIYIFMDEVVNADSLFKRIKTHKKIKQTEGQKWMLACCDAIRFLHVRGIAHRSIKMDHLLISEKSGLKLCGWGRSVIYYDYNKKKLLLQHKEPRTFENFHMPPEAFKGLYNPAIADVWALGVMLICIHNQRYCFNVKSKTDFVQQWKLFTKKHRMNEIVLNLLNRIFVNSPQDRLTLNQIMEHDYFSADNLERPRDDKSVLDQSDWERETTAENSKTEFNARVDMKFPEEESKQAAEPQEGEDSLA